MYCFHPAHRGAVTLTLALLTLLLGLGLSRSQADAPGTVRVGLVKTMFRDIPEPMVRLITAPFGSLLRNQTGYHGQLSLVEDALTLADQLEHGQVHLGVFHGFEFAWAQEKYPQLKPLVIAVHRQHNLAAYLVSRNDTNARELADLKGRKLSLPLRTREHCRLWLERHCDELGNQPESFFAEICKHRSVENALDDVLRGKVHCALVDGVGLACYQRVKPGCHARLKVVEHSEVFPAGVIAYREGALDSAMLTRFQNGLLQASSNSQGREMLNLWKLSGFESVPSSYTQVLANIRRAYPSPESRTRKNCEITTERN